MTKHELIRAGRKHLYNAGVNLDANNHKQYSKHMQATLDLLLEKLVGGPPQARADKPSTFNPEQVLEEIAIAIKHRTISHTHRWKIIFYHERLTCVPAYADVPSQIVLHEFTERMVHRGFSVIYWNQLKQNVIKFYKEFRK